MSHKLCVVVLCISGLLAQALGQEDNFKCPDEFEGFYPHLYSCDKYWHCKSGKSNLKLCGNGLAFDDIDPTFTSENCDYLHNIDCGNRKEIEPAISAPNCPRLFGTFPDPDDCTGFFNCRDGLANRYSCAPGLAFDVKDRVCKWADQVKTCKKNSKEDEDAEGGAFKCPSNGPVGIFTKHAHPEDCRQYFVCISGTPREYGCPLGTVFKVGLSDTDGKCADPEDVPECSNYYGDLAFDKQDLVRAGVDPEAVGAPVASTRSRVPISRAPTPTAAPTPIRVRPATVSSPVEDEEESDDVEFDTELRIQDLPKPQPVNPERANLRTRPQTTTTTTTPAPVAKSQPTRPLKQHRFTLSSSTTDVPVTTPSAPSSTVSFTTTTAEELQEATTTTATLVEVVQDDEPVSGNPSSLPAATGERQPAKVKAGEDYYYYYYYYDDEDEAKAGSSAAPAAPAAAATS